MMLRKILLAGVLVVLTTTGPSRADEPKTIDDVRFAKLHSMIKPQPGESRWMEIDWYPSVQEGRQKAAAEGKPIFIMAGSGGAPAAGC